MHFAVPASSVAIAGSVIYLVYQATLTLKELRSILQDLKETTHDIQSVKNALRFTFLKDFYTVITQLLRQFIFTLTGMVYIVS